MIPYNVCDDAHKSTPLEATRLWGYIRRASFRVECEEHRRRGQDLQGELHTYAYAYIYRYDIGIIYKYYS
jgi:hypothetical protein